MVTVREFFSSKSVFITGGTGYMGKVLIFRLLTCCPEIDKIYLLIRPLKEESVHKRLAAVLAGVAFEKISKENPALIRKVVAVAGNILAPELGLQKEDLSLLFETVSVVFHTAATVKFDEALKTALEVNVSGTKKLIQLCRQMKKLEAFVHISTAYSNCQNKRIGEIIYDPQYPPDNLIRAVEWLNEAAVQAMTPKLIPPWPNTYTFTKALAESAIRDEAVTNFAIAIVRPSIIGAAVLHPFPGYVDNYNGPSGLLAAIGKGALRVMLGDCSAVADIVPVDFVTDFLIAVPWYISTFPTANITVFNYTSGASNPITWGFIQDSSCINFRKNPIERIYREPDPHFTSHRLLSLLLVAYQHLLPAHIMDLMSIARGQKPTIVTSYRKLHVALKCLEYFTSHSWDFENKNVQSVVNALPLEDAASLQFDLGQLDWNRYMENYCLGVKIYLLKEKVENLPLARKNLARCVRLARLVKLVLLGLLLFVVGKNYKLFTNSTMIILSLMVRLLSVFIRYFVKV